MNGGVQTLRPATGARVAGALGWGLLALGPVAILMVHLLTNPADMATPLGQLATLRALSLFAKSVALACAVAIGATLLAIVLARWARDTPYRQLRGLAWVPLLLVLVPPYVHATAWMNFGTACMNGLALLGLQTSPLPSALAVLWIELAAVFPISLAFALTGVAMADSRQIDAARVFANDQVVFFKIELPQILPAASIGAVLAFLLCFTDFSIPALLQIEVYALEVFVEYSIAADGLVAFIIALPMTALCIILILGVATPVRALAISAPRRPGRTLYATPLPLLGVTQLAKVFALLQVGVPIVMLSATAYPFTALWQTILENSAEIALSLSTATLAAGISVLLALALVGSLGTGLRLMLVLIPLAVPSALTGIGAIQLWTLPGLDAFYNTAAMPVVVAVARFAPVAVLALFIQTHRCDGAPIDAARVFRGDGAAVWLRIALPLWAPGLVAGFFAVFGLTLSELTANLLVAPPGYQTLTAKIFGLLHYGASAQASALCLVVLLTSMASMAGVVLATRSARSSAKGQDA